MTTKTSNIIWFILTLFLLSACQSDYDKLEARTEGIIESELQPKIDEITNAFNNHKEVFITFCDTFLEDPNVMISLWKDGKVEIDGDESKSLTIEDMTNEKQIAFRELQNVISFEAIFCLPDDISFNYYNQGGGNPTTWVNFEYYRNINAEGNTNEWMIFLDDHWYIDYGVGWGV